MEWVDFEKSKPKKNGYYLCRIWTGMADQYGASSRYEVCYFHEGKFTSYPIEYWEQEIFLRDFSKVIWWCEIEEAPSNGDHYKLPEPPKK